jgi:TPR repeat protein
MPIYSYELSVGRRRWAFCAAANDCSLSCLAHSCAQARTLSSGVGKPQHPIAEKTMNTAFRSCVAVTAAFACLIQTNAGAPQGSPFHARQAADLAGAGDDTARDYPKDSARRQAAEAQYNLGSLYDRGEGIPQDDAQSLYWYRKAADQGNAPAQIKLGDRYQDQNWSARDDAQAVRWYRLAADQGFALARYRLGLMYATGRGVEQDFVQAAVWYQMAADQGLAIAQFDLGYLYLKGRGLEQDLSQAIDWYRKAADQGCGDAQYSLALIYLRGRGVQQDFVQAIEWFILARASGVTRAEPKLEALERRATPSQLAEARALANAKLGRAAWASMPNAQTSPDSKLRLVGAP